MKKSFEEYGDEKLYYLLCEENENSDRAFAELYARHSSRVFAYCRRFLGNKEEAQDVFQETFIRFHQSSSKDRVMTNVPAYILRIARNLCVNSKRKEKSHLTFEDYMVGDDDESKSDKDELLELVKTALEVLPDKYKEMFILREYDGMSYAEIGEITDESVSTVKVRIYRAKQKIREVLSPYINELEKFNK